MSQIAIRSWGGRFVVPIPEFLVIDGTAACFV